MDYRQPKPVFVSKNMYVPSMECWKQQALKVKEVQKITDGAGAVLGYLDDGIGINLELENVEVDRLSFFETSGNVGDHSTFGATLVAGKTLGIYPKLKFVSKQVMDPDSGTGGSKQIVSAIIHAMNSGIQTINLSFGSSRPDSSIEKALKNYCSNGINVATISSGNDGPSGGSSDWPANYAKTIKGVFSVAATQITRDGEIQVAMFSSRGVVTLGAPGNGLKSMDTKNSIDFISGTSYSSPIVGATIAVARTLIKRPLTQDEILGIFQETCAKIDTPQSIGAGHIQIIDFLKRVKSLEVAPVKIKQEGFFKKCFSSILN